jgi:hypothetical protein
MGRNWTLDCAGSYGSDGLGAGSYGSDWIYGLDGLGVGLMDLWTGLDWMGSPAPTSAPGLPGLTPQRSMADGTFSFGVQQGSRVPTGNP